MNKQDKETIISGIKEKLDKATSIYLTDFAGLTVKETNELRDELFHANVDYKVFKNTLIKKALEGGDNKFSAKFDIISEHLKGPTGVIFTYDDPVSPARIIKKFYDKSEKPKLKVALVEDVAYDRTKLNDLASLQSKSEVISSIIGSLHAPISGIVHTINAVFRDLASIVEEVAKTKNAN